MPFSYGSPTHPVLYKVKPAKHDHDVAKDNGEANKDHANIGDDWGARDVAEAPSNVGVGFETISVGAFVIYFRNQGTLKVKSGLVNLKRK